MDKVVQMELVGVIGILGAMALYFAQPNLAQVAIAGLIGFLGGQIMAAVPRGDDGAA